MRKPLQINDVLTLPLLGNDREIRIDRVLGDGASSIVYVAVYKDSEGYSHDVIIKECYPFGANIVREKDSLYWEDANVRKMAFEKFKEAYNLLSRIHRSGILRNSTACAFDLVEANGTLYSIQMLNEGHSYAKDSSCELKENLQTILALTKVIGKYHEQGYLHLDIKPENFLVIPETRELVILFDVDSVTKVSDLKEGLVKAVSYSEGWGAPEQTSGDPGLLCPATDIFSIGSVLFNKVLGKKVTAEDMGIFSTWQLSECLPADTNPKLIRILKEIFRNTLCASAKRRYQSTEELIAKLEEAIKAAEEKTYILSNCPPALAKFIGREDDLAAIRRCFESGTRAVFLHGFGGMGKTELAKKYAERYEDTYDACVFRMYSESTGLEGYLGSIPVANDEKDGQEKETIRQLRSLMKTSQVLLIVDNFDVDDDELLDDLLSLPADILITTRNNYSELISDEKTRVVELDTMPVTDLIRLFIREYGVLTDTDEIEAAKEIIDYTDRWTMAVPIVARQIAASGGTVRAYADQMAEDGFASSGEDAEEIRIRYQGKTLRKTPLDILRYVFDMGRLTESERTALRNLRVLHIHGALTKERYRYYTGDKNLTALNHLIFLNWVTFDAGGILSLHSMVQDLVRHDLAITPESVPGIFSYIKHQFELLDDYRTIDEAQTITFAMLMLTEIACNDFILKGLYSHLGSYIDYFYEVDPDKLYLQLFVAPDESTYYMHIDYVVREICAAIETPGEEAAINEKINWSRQFMHRWNMGVSWSAMQGNYLAPILINVIDPQSGLDSEEDLIELVQAEREVIDVCVEVIPKPKFNKRGDLQYRNGYPISLEQFPEAYRHYHLVLQWITLFLIGEENFDITPKDELVEYANELIIEIESSLGNFCHYGLSRQQILEYRILTDEEYATARHRYKCMHWNEKSKGWYDSLMRWLNHCDDPYPVYKMLLSSDFGISKARAGQLVKHGFATRVLEDTRLSSQKLQELVYRHCPESANAWREKVCRNPYASKTLGRHCKSIFTVYAQLLSGAEPYLTYHQTDDELPLRIGLYRAAFLLKRTIGAEIFDPKPYVLKEIQALAYSDCPQALIYFEDLVDLAELTRTSGYIKQSQMMKKLLLDICAKTEFLLWPESVTHYALCDIIALACNNNRTDVLDKVVDYLSLPYLGFESLFESDEVTLKNKRRLCITIAAKYIDALCLYYSNRAKVYETNPKCADYPILQEKLFELMMPYIPNSYEFWNLPSRFHAAYQLLLPPDKRMHDQGLIDILDRIMCDYCIYRRKEHVEGLIYLAVDKISRGVLEENIPDMFMTLTETFGYSNDEIELIIKNIITSYPIARELLGQTD